MLYLTPDHQIAASPQIWIFVLASALLTVSTIAFWIVRKRQHEKARDALLSTLNDSELKKGN